MVPYSRIAFAMLTILVALPSTAQSLLPSWNDGPTKKAILEFVAAVTDEKGRGYVVSADSRLR
jgi:hypothetical protein